jgi:hypothetical protein
VLMPKGLGNSLLDLMGRFFYFIISGGSAPGLATSPSRKRSRAAEAAFSDLKKLRPSFKDRLCLYCMAYVRA